MRFGELPQLADAGLRRQGQCLSWIERFTLAGVGMWSNEPGDNERIPQLVEGWKGSTWGPSTPLKLQCPAHASRDSKQLVEVRLIDRVAGRYKNLRPLACGRDTLRCHVYPERLVLLEVVENEKLRQREARPSIA